MCDYFMTGKKVWAIQRIKRRYWNELGKEVTQNEGGQVHRPSSNMICDLSKSVEDGFLNTYSLSPSWKSTGWWMKEQMLLLLSFGKIIVSDITFFYSLLSLFKVYNPQVQPFPQNDFSSVQSLSHFRLFATPWLNKRQIKKCSGVPRKGWLFSEVGLQKASKNLLI